MGLWSVGRFVVGKLKIAHGFYLHCSKRVGCWIGPGVGVGFRIGEPNELGIIVSIMPHARPFLIKAPVPTVEETAQSLGVSRKDLLKIQSVVDQIVGAEPRTKAAAKKAPRIRHAAARRISTEAV
jgi:hypothetical protein